MGFAVNKSLKIANVDENKRNASFEDLIRCTKTPPNFVKIGPLVFAKLATL